MNINIAYQGVIGSNNEVAAHEFAQTMGYENITFKEGVCSQGVVDLLKSGHAKLGVVATYNNLVGDVGETTLALDGLEYNILATTKLHIHHALFVKNADCEIHTFASHPHALGQCSKYIATNYPDAVQKELKDTAIGATLLSNGELPDTTGILCRRNAGEAVGLHMLSENVADDIENYTTFILFELK